MPMVAHLLPLALLTMYGSYPRLKSITTRNKKGPKERLEPRTQA